MSDRKAELLTAVLDFLRRSVDSAYVVDPLEGPYYYDDTECDGLCLIDDIENELGATPEGDDE